MARRIRRTNRKNSKRLNSKRLNSKRRNTKRRNTKRRNTKRRNTNRNYKGGMFPTDITDITDSDLDTLDLAPLPINEGMSTQLYEFVGNDLLATANTKLGMRIYIPVGMPQNPVIVTGKNGDNYNIVDLNPDEKLPWQTIYYIKI